MTVSRRDLFCLAGTGAVMLGAPASAAQKPAAPAPFVASTADRFLKLCFNENPRGMTEAAKKAAKAALADASRYPFERSEALRKACAAFMSGRPENIMLSHGSAESIRAAVESHIQADTILVVPELTYSDGADTAAKNGVKVKKVRMTPELAIDVAAMQKAAAAHKGHVIVYFVNPNNPTSNIVSSRALLDWIASKPADTFFVIDEAYAEYVEDPSFVSCKTLVDKGFENLCVVKTFSKIFGLAGMRVGFTYAAPAVVETVKKQVAYDFFINNVAIEAALAELNDPGFVEAGRRDNAAARRVLTDALDTMKIRYLKSEANFVFMELKGLLKPFADRMKVEHILVGRPFPPANRWCRVSIGTVPEMQYFVEKLQDFRKKGWI